MNIYDTKRMVVYGCTFVVGLVLVVLNVFELIPVDPAISGLGGGLAGVSAVRLFLGAKYRKDEEYAKHIDVINSDERNIFISNKAKLWSFFLTIIICAIVSIGLLFTRYREYSVICGSVVCGMCFIYFVAYIILNRRY